MMDEEFNPWNVENLDDFLQYCCPECEVKHVSKTEFVTHAVDEHPKSHEHWAIFGLKNQRKIVRPKLLKKRKKVSELEIETKKSKVEGIQNNSACENDYQDQAMHHSIEIVKDELVEPKSDNELKDEKCDSEPEPEPDEMYKPLEESVAVMEEVDDELYKHEINEEEENSESELTPLDLMNAQELKPSDFVSDNEECDSEPEPPELVSEDFPIIKIPCTTLIKKKELYEILEKHNIPFQNISPFSFTYHPPKMAKAMKKHHPLLKHLSEMSLHDLRALFEFISSDCKANIGKYRMQKTLKEYYFKKHRKSPLTSFLKDKERVMPIHQAIAIFNYKTVLALIWHSGDHSSLVYSTKEAKAKLQKICFKANPGSPLSYLQKLKQKEEAEKKMIESEMEAKKSKKTSDTIIDRWTDITVEQKSCFLCDSRFEDFVFLRNHMRTEHSSNGTFQCTECEYKEKSFDSFCFHLTKKHQIGDYLYKCLPCQKNFPRVGLLREHKTVFHPEGGDTSNFFPCPLCEVKFPKITYFGNHMRNVHSVDGNFRCHLCFDKFNNYNDFAFHLTDIHELGKFQYQCDICNKAFSGNTTLLEHKKYVHEGASKQLAEPEKVFCDKCGKSYVNQNSLKSHMMRIHNEYEITDKDLHKKCEQCGKVFNEPQEFDHHLRLCLKDPKELSCKFCDTKWVSHLSLELHITSEHKKILFACDICGLSTDQSTLSKHKKSVHEKKYDHICHLCGKGFQAPCDLQEHLGKIHGQGEPKHKCETCGKKYWNTFNLKTHIESNHSNSTYPCGQCSKVFKVKNYLQTHVRIVHENYKPFKCDLCEEKFLYERDLKRHKRCHHH